MANHQRRRLRYRCFDVGRYFHSPKGHRARACWSVRHLLLYLSHLPHGGRFLLACVRFQRRCINLQHGKMLYLEFERECSRLFVTITYHIISIKETMFVSGSNLARFSYVSL
jgi:hypothetical protein